jgi:hypothetical protein
MEMSMTYLPVREVFPADADSLQAKMFRLRQEIVEAQQYRRELDGEGAPQGALGHGNGLDASQGRMQKQLTDLRIWEMEARLTALLDSYGD